jgi:hypothetical protein
MDEGRGHVPCPTAEHGAIITGFGVQVGVCALRVVGMCVGECT